LAQGDGYDSKIESGEPTPLSPAVASKLEVEHHPDRLLVRFKSRVTPAARQAAHANADATRVLKEFKYVRNLFLVEVPANELPQALAQYSANPDVAYAEPDYIVRTVDIPNDPDFEELWGMHNTGQFVWGIPGTPGADIRAVAAWALWTGDPEFRIAVIDTGVNYLHPDLADNIWTNPGEIPGNGIDDDGNGWVDDIHGYDFVNGDGDPMADNQHGSHVAGTIGAVGNNGVGVVGVNWQCKIVALKFIGASGTGSTSGAVASMEYAVANGIRVSNNSWGGGAFSEAMRDVIAESRDIDHVFVAAAGNDGRDTDTDRFYPACYDEPNIISGPGGFLELWAYHGGPGCAGCPDLQHGRGERLRIWRRDLDGQPTRGRRGRVGDEPLPGLAMVGR
jgi:subtilisin family serine protease